MPLQVLSTPGEKFVIVETPDYRISREYKEGFLFLHSRIFSWSLSIYKELLGVMNDILQEAYVEGNDFVYTLVRENTVKFDTMFGFEIDTVYDINGERIFLMKQATYGS